MKKLYIYIYHQYAYTYHQYDRACMVVDAASMLVDVSDRPFSIHPTVLFCFFNRKLCVHEFGVGGMDVTKNLHMPLEDLSLKQTRRVYRKPVYKNLDMSTKADIMLFNHVHIVE